MHVQSAFLKNASTKKFFCCAIASGENRPASRTGARVWASRRRKRVGVICYADHLGTPRAITRPSDNQVVWTNDNVEPFGNSAPNENPSGLGQFHFNLRFAGQYYDAETGTFYNYFRDYDPATGRYIQSDPIGLSGGINTFAYVEGNPLSFIDPDGTARVTGALRLALAAARAAKEAIQKSYSFCKNIRCKIAIHGAHHPFGWPFNKKMCHVQLNCWVKGSKGSKFVMRFPYPCSWPGAPAIGASPIIMDDDGDGGNEE